jgi:glycosyltransferase involved in cell wall biosynthesis
LRAAWVQIVPSECFEQTPLAIPEAWAEGVPVIAARLGAMLETVGVDPPAAAQFTAGDAADLARVVRTLHGDVRAQAMLVARGDARCRELYSPAASLAALERIYAMSASRESVGA